MPHWTTCSFLRTSVTLYWVALEVQRDGLAS
jgi:hypothetical protein